MIYKKIAKQLRNRINSNEFEIGDCLPSEIALAKDYVVSRMTLRKAIDSLVHSGLITRQHGRGTFIANKDVEYTSQHLKTFSESLHNTTQRLRSEVHEFSIKPAPLSIAKKLKIKEGKPLYHIVRVRYLNDQPIQIEESYLPVAMFPDLSVRHLEGSKFHYVEVVAGMKIKGCTESFTTIMPNEKQKSTLKVSGNTPLLHICSINENDSGQIFDLSLIVVNSQRYPMTYYFHRHQESQ
ncbi:GntR family transcriptional regulator [Photobacterium satsumensis]|uniref:GntR family transcriptional regulator n=1 Tax=Photobacterium satsumensis TaxID=2910239 RepID=UPI003D0CC83F